MLFLINPLVAISGWQMVEEKVRSLLKKERDWEGAVAKREHLQKEKETEREREK